MIYIHVALVKGHVDKSLLNFRTLRLCGLFLMTTEMMKLIMGSSPVRSLGK